MPTASGADASSETGSRQQHECRRQRPHARLGDGLGDRKDRAELKADQERVGSSVATIGVKSDVGMHTADTGPARRDDRVCHSSSSGKDDFNVLLDQVDRLTDTAAQMLADEKKLG